MPNAGAPGAAADDRTTHFGFEDVRLSEKQPLVDGVFTRVAGRYDLMNDVMSGGLHRLWKDVLIARVNPSRTRRFAHLDVAGGTGDVAYRLLAAGGPATHVHVLDINSEMLAAGRKRPERRRYAGRLDFIQGNAEALPLATGSFDAYTIAFGMRNVPRIDAALREAYRVLRRGGRFYCLEFSEVDVPVFDRLYDAFSFSVIPTLGKVFAGDGEPYRYLVESIRRFPMADAYASMIEDAGFRRVSYTRLTGGIAAIHSGWKF